MEPQIEYLKWDSELFGKKIGRVKLGSSEGEGLNTLMECSDKYDLLYVFAEEPIDSLNEHLADIKLTFQKKPGFYNLEFKFIHQIDSENPDCYNDLLELAFLSGKYSRFKTDPRMPEDAFKELYQKWVNNTLDKTFGEGIFIYREKSQIRGFITINRSDSNTCEIGLISVYEKFQGRGIAKELISYINNYAIRKHCLNIEVSTQGKNREAIALYEKTGFVQKSATYIYHLWK